MEIARLNAVITANTAGLTRALAQANTAMGQTAARARAMDGAVASSAAGMNRAGAAGGAAMRALKIGSVAAAVGLGYAVKQAADFESSLNTFQAVSKATNAQMGQMSSLAKKLGADVKLPGTSAADAADAMIALSKGGLSVTNTMKAARGVLTLSAAAQIDNATAATITADALNAFGLSGDKATKVADLLAASSVAASGEITDTAMAMRMSATVASQMGVSIEGLTTMLSSMAKAGLRGSDAGTSVKTMLMRLGAPTSQAKSAMDALGVSVYDANGAMKPMVNIIGQFENALKNKSQAERQAALQTIFGADAIRAANVMIARGVSGYVAMERAVRRQGAAQDLATAKMKGFKGALEGFQSSVETLAITVGTPLLSSLTTAVRGVSNLTGAMAESPAVEAFANDMGEVGTALLGVGRAAGTVVAPVIGGLGMAMGGVAKSANEIPGVMQVAGAAIATALGVSAIGKVTALGRAMAQTAGGSAVGSMVKGVGTVGMAFSQAAVGAGRFAQTNPFAPHIKGMGRFSTALTASRGAVGMMGATLTSALGGPVGIGIAAVTGLTAGFFALRSAIGQTPTTAQAAAASMHALAAATTAASLAASNYRTVVANYGGLVGQQVLLEQQLSAAKENTRRVTAAANADGRVTAQESRAIAAAKAQEKIAEAQVAQARKASNTEGANVVKSAKEQTGAMQRKTAAMLDTVTKTDSMARGINLAGKSQAQQVKDSKAAADAATRYNERLDALPKVLQKQVQGLQQTKREMKDSGAPPSVIKGLDTQIQRRKDLITELKNTAKVKVPEVKSPKPVNLKATDGITPAVTDALQALQSANGRSATVTLTTRKVTVTETRGGTPGGGFTGGWVTGYASGGMVSGPGGRDKVPAMLTAGEVVLTKRQQSLVNAGMNIDAALRKTGGKVGVGGFATGGRVDTGRLSTATSSAQQILQPITVTVNLAEVKAEAAKAGVVFDAALAKRIAAEQKALAAAIRRSEALQKQEKPNAAAVEATRKTIERLTGSIKTNAQALQTQGQALAAVKQRIIEAYSARELQSFDRATSAGVASIRSSYDGLAQGSVDAFTRVATATGRIEGAFERNERETRDNLKNIERNFSGTWKNLAGQVQSGSFKDFERALAAGQKAIQAKFDALTPAEAALRALQDEGASSGLADQLQEARDKLSEAQKWGDPAAIKEAQKALGEAERQSRIAELTKTAESERATAEENRAAETEALATHYEEERTALQEQLDGKLESERVAGENRRALLEGQLATETQQYEDQRAGERVALENRLKAFGEHFARLRAMTTGNNKSILKQFRGFAEKIETSGANLGESFAVGIGNAIPGIAEAAKRAGKTVAQYLQLNSPAEKGPLSHLDTFWDALGPTLVSGAGSLDEEMRRWAAVSGTGTGAARSGSTTVNLTVTDQTFAGMSREQADRVAREVKAALDRQVAYSL